MITRRELFRNSFYGLVGLMTSKTALSLFDDDYVFLYDTFAMALYMDGSLGPKTGIIKVDYILENKPVVLPFWHGHGGKVHEFELNPEHYQDLILQQTVILTTSKVEHHAHKLFIDPINPKWRVPGAQPIKVPRFF